MPWPTRRRDGIGLRVLGSAIVGLVCLMASDRTAGGGEISGEKFIITFEGVSEERVAAFHEEAKEAFSALTDYLGITFDRRIRIRIRKRLRAPSFDAGKALIIIDADRFLGRAPGPAGVVGRVPGIVHDLADILFPSGNPNWGDMLQEGFGVFLQERFGAGARAYPAMGQELHETTAKLIVDSEGFVRLQDSARRLERLHFGRAHRLTMMHQGSFVKYLIEMHGLEKFLRVHQGRRLADIYNSDLCKLEDRWVAFIVGRFPATAPYGRTRERCREF